MSLSANQSNYLLGWCGPTEWVRDPINRSNASCPILGILNLSFTVFLIYFVTEGFVHATPPQTGTTTVKIGG